MADPQHLPAVVVGLPAEIDTTSAGRVSQQLGAAFAPGVKTVIADMTATRFCDSSGISVLVRAHKHAAANGTQLRLVVHSTVVLRSLRLVQMDYLLPIYPTLSQALAAGPPSAPHTHHQLLCAAGFQGLDAVPGYPGGAPATPPEAITSCRPASRTAAGKDHQR